MPITTTPITGSLPLLDGTDATNAVLHLRLTAIDAEGADAILPILPPVYLDGADLPAGFELWPNSSGLIGTVYVGYVEYMIGSRLVTTDEFTFEVGANASYTIGELIATGADAPGSYPTADIPAEEFTGTTYTLLSADRGKAKESTNSSAVTVTLPATLSAGFSCLVMQGGTGQITFVAASGATIRQDQSLTKTYARWSQVSIRVRKNTGGNAAEYVLDGGMI